MSNIFNSAALALDWDRPFPCSTKNSIIRAEGTRTAVRCLSRKVETFRYGSSMHSLSLLRHGMPKMLFQC